MSNVQLEQLRIVNFRNLEKTVIHPGERFNIISGKNGVGKTNLLESIYLLGTLRSFRTAVRRELILQKHDTARITGVFGKSLAGMNCEITLGPTGRVVKIDEKKVTVANSYFNRLPMVLFHPGNMELMQSGPDTRRRFLDRALYQAEPAYPSIYRSYKKALSSRNALLKKGSPTFDSLLPYTIQLAEFGTRIHHFRASLIQSLCPLFVAAVDFISNDTNCKMSYKPRISGSKEDFLTAFEKSFSNDRIRGYTTLGPHADDVLFEVKGQDARKFASQGQQRTAVLAAKIAETQTLTEKTKKVPLLLLDDISSELDNDRNKKLFEFLAGVGGQVFITTTHLEHIKIQTEKVHFRVDNGLVTPQ